MDILTDILGDLSFLIFILILVKWQRWDVLDWVGERPYKALIALFVGISLVRVMLLAGA